LAKTSDRQQAEKAATAAAAAKAAANQANEVIKALNAQKAAAIAAQLQAEQARDAAQREVRVAQSNANAADQAKQTADAKKSALEAQEAAAKAAVAKAAAAAADAKAAAAAAKAAAASKAAAAAARRAQVSDRQQKVTQAETVIGQKKDALKRVSDSLAKALDALSRANKDASQAQDSANKAKAHADSSDDRIKAAARVYAKSVVAFNKAVNDHTQTFGSKKSDLMKSNVDVIDCAQYGGCNNNANGVGGVGVNVDNTNTMIGHRNAVKSAGSALDQANTNYALYLKNFEQASRTLNGAESAQQSAQVRVNSANSRARKCYHVSVAPTCGGNGRPKCNENTHRQITQTARMPFPDLQCPSHVDKSNWLTRDNHKDRFAVSTQHNTVSITRIDSNGPWGMTVVMNCCETEIEKARAALQQTQNNVNAARAALASAKQSLASARARRDAAQKAHDSAKTAQKNQKY